MKRLTKWLLLGTGGLTLPLLPILILLLAFLALLSSESGSRWLIIRTLEHIPVGISVEAIDGTLMQGLSLRGLSVDTEAMSLQVDTVDSTWHLRTLLTGRFVLDELNVDGVDLMLHPAAAVEPQEPGAWPGLSAGMPVVVKQARIRHLQLVQGENVVLVPEIRLAASQGPFATRIDELFVEVDGHRLQLSGRLRNRPPYDMDISADLLSQWPPYADTIEASVAIRGGLDAPALKIEVRQPSPLTLNATLDTGFKAETTALDPQRLRMSAEVIWQHLKIPSQLFALPTVSDGTLTVDGSLDDYRVKGLIDVVADNYPATNVALDLRGGGTGIVVEDMAIVTDSGRINALGKLDWQPRLQWDFSLHLDHIDPGALQADWPGDISGHLVARGHLSQNGNQHGGQDSSRNSLLVNLDIEQLAGHLRQFPLLAKGAISYDGTSIASPGFQLELEENRIAFDGKLVLPLGVSTPGARGSADSEMTFNWQISATNLAALLPGLSGQMESSGSARGTLKRPVVNADTSIEKLRYMDYRADALKLAVASNPYKAEAMNLSLRADGLTVPGLQQAELAFDWRGNILEHAVDLDLKTGALAARLMAAGGWQNQQWNGQLQKLELEELRAGYWHLQEPADLTVAAAAVQVSKFCLEQQVQREQHAAGAAAVDAVTPGSRQAMVPREAAAPREFSKGQLCGSGSWNRKSGVRAEGQISGLDLAFIEPWLPLTTSVSGTISGDFQVQGLPPDLTGSLRLRGSPGEFVYQRNAKEVDRYPFGGLELQGEGSLDQWLTSFRFELPGDGLLGGSLDYGVRSGAMVGALTVSFASLKWFEIFLPSLDEIDGTFAADLLLKGKVSEPDISGTINLDGFTAQVPELGIQLEHGTLAVRRDGNEPWQLSSSLKSGKGELKANGSLDWNWKTPWQAQLALKGERFQFIDVPELSAQANAALDLRADARKLTLTGEVKVPKANVVIKKLPESAVVVASDTIIIEDESRVAVDDQARPYEIYSNVRLILGEDVHFSGFGITSELSGSLNLVERPGKPTRIEGEVTVLDGIYKSYGQLLEIEEGRLIFRGPADNPGLSLRAVRYYEQTKVGIIIGGTARDLRSEVFAEPALPTSEAMAILLTGKPLERANKSEATKLSDAAAALGISQSKYVTQRLQSTLGVDVLKLNSGETLEESSLIVGKYLSPRLYVAYVKDLFNPGALVNLEYKIGRRFKLKAEAGAHQSIDLLYIIDR